MEVRIYVVIAFMVAMATAEKWWPLVTLVIRNIKGTCDEVEEFEDITANHR